MAYFGHSPPDWKQVKRVTLATCLTILSFWLFFDVSKHNSKLAQVNPFGEDPFDAVGSFGLQLAMFCGLLSVIRLLRPYPNGAGVYHLRRIVYGDAVALLVVGVTLAADSVAILGDLHAWTTSLEGWLLAGWVIGMLGLTIFVGSRILLLFRATNPPTSIVHTTWKNVMLCLVGAIFLAINPSSWHATIAGSILAALAGMALLFIMTSALAKSIFPNVDEPIEDLLDDLLALCRGLKARTGFTGFPFRWIENAVQISWVQSFLGWLNPRKHAWNAVVLVALGLGIALILAETLGEGAPDTRRILLVLSAVIGIETCGVLMGYALFKSYLGLVRS
jgi:hypothetical protein